MRWARIALAFSFVLGGFALAACGEDGEQTTTVTVQAEESEELATAPAPDPGPTPAEAEAYVEEFYDLINAYRYRGAWPLLPESVQDNAGSFSAWKAGYVANLVSRSTDVHPFGATKKSVGVALSLIARDADACTGAIVRQGFTGAWHFARSGDEWVPQSITMDKVEGETPRIHPSECPGAPDTDGGGDTDVSSAEKDVAGGGGLGDTSSACDPNYSGQCLDPTSPDYDCEGGSGDGPDYVGQVQVMGSDQHGLDADGNGIGCEG